jgi:pimeloyl-ACP methyl ester carboxylesterase
VQTAVLVHGGFHGGWCWAKVRRELEARGWAVYAPSLTGLADRAHLASPDVALETHIRDITALIEFERLDDIVLCGHSAGGMVVTAVADRMPERIKHLIYLDAIVPDGGQSLLDVMSGSPEVVQAFRDLAASQGDGWQVPPVLFTAADCGVEDPTDQDWVDRLMTAHPLRAFSDPVTLTGRVSEVPHRTYIRCTRFDVAYGEPTVSRFEEDPNWHTERWDVGHDAMVTSPNRLVDVIAGAVQG